MASSLFSLRKKMGICQASIDQCSPPASRKGALLFKSGSGEERLGPMMCVRIGDEPQWCVRVESREERACQSRLLMQVCVE